MLLLIYGIFFTNWGPTNGRTDQRTDRPTDIASYRDAMDASKNKKLARSRRKWRGVGRRNAEKIAIKKKFERDDAAVAKRSLKG